MTTRIAGTQTFSVKRHHRAARGASVSAARRQNEPDVPLYGAKTVLRRQGVLVNETAETIPAQNPRVDGC
jgi:hypothetical protein